MNTLGDLQHLVLLAILRLGDAAYGISIRDEILERAGRNLTLGAIYSALRRLEARGAIQRSSGTVPPESGERTRTYFRLTSSGLTAVRETQGELVRMVEGLGRLPLSSGAQGNGE